ncbi:DUF819 family protein [Olivibacter ginsenosidimutans]|uniref:DUF819 family protein n=1 Tax=Olivibacter ginsenosidimutans TaxID=1176537 RepID=A0ABP9BLL3_9SPHI
MEKAAAIQPLITNDAVVFGLLMIILALIFYTSSLNHRFFKGLYAVLPTILLCYFIPGLLNSFHIISGSQSKLYDMSSNYLLPACLILFTLNLNFKELWKLRKKAGVMFITGSIGILLGGPLALWLVSLVYPQVTGGEGADATWRGLAALAGSWIGGGANEAALYSIFKPSPELFSAIIAVDVFVAYGWMAFLLYGVGKNEVLNRFFKADNQVVEELQQQLEAEQKANARIPETKDLIVMMGLAFGATGLAHFLANPIADWIALHAPALDKFSLTSSFFWVILVATFLGILLSFTGARRLEHAGASRVGSVFLYVLVATIGMQMNIFAILGNPALFLVGLIWLSFHILLLVIVGKLIRAPYFFLAVGSMANVGGVASSTVVAATFNPSLISVGVVLAVLGYAIGTYGGYLCAILMQWIS